MSTTDVALADMFLIIVRFIFESWLESYTAYIEGLERGAALAAALPLAL
jgi:hypothetical protein